MNADSTSLALQRIIEEEWAYRLENDPFYATSVGDQRWNARVTDPSSAAEAERARQCEAFVDRLNALERAELTEPERLNLDLLTRDLNDRLETFRFGAYRAPVSRLIGPHVFIPDLILVTRFAAVQDFDAYLQRLDGLSGYFQRLAEVMREGMALGLMPAKNTLVGVADSYRAFVTGDLDTHVFLKPFEGAPPAVDSQTLARRREAAKTLLRESVLPAFAGFADFIETEYAPAAREATGLNALSGGAEYYAFLVKKYTTLNLTPEAVYAVGLNEVARIRAEMEALIQKAGFQGSYHEFLAFLHSDPRFYVTEPVALMRHVAWIMKRMDGELPRLFEVLPRTPYGMRETPAHIAPNSTSAYYFPATGDGATAGYYYVNTYDLPSRPLYEYEALSFHEAVPGHHLQLALQQEMQNTPAFRRFSPLDAFIEGWALYSERLGLEVGFYQDVYSDFGRLIFEMWRAARLVVDPGLHAFGWTRQQAIDYMAEYTALSPLNIANEVDRYIAMPGQAVSYKIGELKMRQLREYAEKRLGQRFDLRRFHRLLLEEGAIPLELLENKINAWVDSLAS